MIKNVLWFFILTSLLLAPAPPSAAQVQQITIAIGENSPPYYYLDRLSRPQGWLVDLWRLWGQKSGVKVRFAPGNLEAVLQQMELGRVQVLGGIDMAGQEKDRLELVDPPLFKVSAGFIYRNDLIGINKLEDLRPFVIGFIKDSPLIEVLLQRVPGLAIKEYPDNDALMQALKNNQLKVMCKSVAVAKHFLAQHGMTNKFRYHPELDLDEFSIRAYVRKGDNETAELIKSGLAKINPDEFAALERRWMGSGPVRDPDILRIACDLDHPPFTMRNQSGQPAGLIVDYWRLWAQKTGKHVEFVFENWEGVQSLVRDKKADIVAAIMKSDERQTWLDFSLPIMPMASNLFYRAQDGPISLVELHGFKVGVSKESHAAQFLKQKYPDIKQISFTETEDMLNSLKSGDIKAFINISAMVIPMMDRLGLTTEIGHLPEAVYVREAYGAVAKGRSDLLKLINQGMSQVSFQELQDLERRWVRSEDLHMVGKATLSVPLTQQDKDWLAKHKDLKLGIDPHWMPLEAFDENGMYQGISSGYVEHISQKLGVNLNPVSGLTWPQVLDAAKTGQLDVIPCIVQSPDRTEYLQFTRPYISLPLVIVTRKDAKYVMGPDAFVGKTMAVTKNYYATQMAKQNYPGIKYLDVANIKEGLKAVQEGKALGYLDASAVVNYYLQSLRLNDLKIAGATPLRLNLAMGVRKDLPQLVSILEKVLRSMSQAEQAAIEARWSNVVIEPRTDWETLLSVVAVMGAMFILVLGVVFIWNRKLSKEVSRRRLVMEDLERSQERLADLYENAPDMYLVIDLHNSSIIRCNGTASAALGYSKEELYGMPLAQLCGDEDSCTLDMRSFAPDAADDFAEPQLLEVRRADGSILKVLASATAMKDAYGSPSKARYSWRDVNSLIKALNRRSKGS